MENTLFENLGIFDRDARLSLMKEAKENYGVFDVVGKASISDAFGNVRKCQFMIYDQSYCALRQISAHDLTAIRFYKNVVIVNTVDDKLKFNVLTNVDAIDEVVYDTIIMTEWTSGANSITSNLGDTFTFEAYKTFDSACEAMKYIQSGVVDTVLSYSNEDNDIRDELNSLLNSKLESTDDVGEFDMPGM